MGQLDFNMLLGERAYFMRAALLAHHLRLNEIRLLQLADMHGHNRATESQCLCKLFDIHRAYCQQIYNMKPHMARQRLIERQPSYICIGFNQLVHPPLPYHRIK